MENNSSPQKSSTQHYILIALLIIVSVIGIYLAFMNRALQSQLADCGTLKQEVEQEKVEVMENLESLSMGYDSLMTDNDSVNVALVEEKKRVEELIAQAKNKDYSIYKLKKEASTLREIMKGYVRTIDSLNTLNIELTAENIQVRSQLSEQQSVNRDLNQTNAELAGKVRLGSQLEALALIATAQLVKKNGVHRETNRASKVMKIKTCFTLDKNTVAEAGRKAIFVRVVTPTGQVLSDKADKNHMFTFEGTQGLFSVKKIINYENKELDICMYYDVSTTLVPGEYSVKVYADEMEIGATSFSLK